MSDRHIRILPDAVADQIAAGEVVERPASVVKELAENALDADATVVHVVIEQGGRALIEVTDDGYGMGREDAVLALDRHATSKLATAGDLVGIATFGFRGEALPAIASVSRFELLTSDGGGLATRVAVNGGRLQDVEEASRARGTTVAVRGLFFNTPARRKFLRSQGSEARAVLQALTTLALSHPSVGFSLIADGESRLVVPPGEDLQSRITSVWGRSAADTLVPVDYAVGSFHVTGFVQRPGDARPTGRKVQLFINGRPFRDNFLVRAAEAGYRAAIHPGDRPTMLLRLKTSASDVDVNVHPAKLEVRFRERTAAERAVEEATRHAISAVIAAAPLRSQLPGAPWEPGEPGPAHTELFTDVAAAVLPETGNEPRDAPASTQLLKTYLLYEDRDDVVLVDQHSAHERVLYEAVMRSLTGTGAAAQRLLLPLTIDLTDEELEAVDHHGDLLARIGFEVAPFGGRSVVVHAVPAPHPRFDAERCFAEMVADLSRGRFGGWSNSLERFAMTFACRAAVKAGDSLSAAEQQQLLRQLFLTSAPPHDVHGRSTIVRLPRDELERRFGRR